MLARDDFYGHRDPFTGEPMSDGTEWIEWDHALIHALQTIEDYTDEYGLLIWERDDEAVEVDAEKRVHKYKQSVELATRGSDKHPYKPTPGEFFVPKVWSRRKIDGKEVYQTFAEWRNELAAKEAADA